MLNSQVTFVKENNCDSRIGHTGDQTGASMRAVHKTISKSGSLAGIVSRILEDTLGGC